MGDQDNTLAICGQVIDDLHKSLDLLWCQGSSRLIQNQCLCTTIQNLEDFHTLLHTYGNILDLCVRVYFHSVTLGQFQDFLSCCCLVDGQALGRLHTKNDVFGYSKWLDQHKVLVYHTDSDINSILRTVKMYFLFINKNLSAGRFVKSTEYVHHCTLSGSVLSQDRVDLSFVYGQIDVVIRCKIAKLFYDVFHLDYDFALIHMACSSHVCRLLCLLFCSFHCLHWTGK